ncbi:MAG: ABC transporter permease, partial [Alphaproteobacteria bacterium]
PATTTQPGGARTFVIQCDRATTDQRLIRDAEQGRVTLTGLYDLPLLAVDAEAPLQTQIEQAEEIRVLAAELKDRLRAVESRANPYVADNFVTLFQSRQIPLTSNRKAIEDARPSKMLLNLLGLRFERNGQVYERISLITLLKTILFAVLATGLALVVCYPIAYNLALGVSAERAVWLFLALIIPYAIVELLRVYAWLSIIDNNGLINRLLDLARVVDLEAGEYIQFKRSSMTVFVVIVYTYILFMVFPVFNVMSTLDRNQIEAARDLGASTWRVHRRVVIPHAKPGIAVGCIATFMLSAGAFSVPRIISRGLQSEWFTQTIYNKFFESENSNVGAAYAFAYTVICFGIVGCFMWAMRARLKDFVRI